MKNKSITLLASVAIGASAIASISHAQGITFDGANLEFSHVNNVFAGTPSYTQTRVLGSGQLSFGNISIQGDLGVFGYDNDPLDSTYYALHAMYRFSPNLVVGGYFGQDAFFNGTDIWSTYGVEAKYTPGFLDERLTFEAFAGAYKSDTFGTNPMFGLGAVYAVNDRIDIGASYLRGAWDDLGNPNDQYDVLELEGTYNFDSGLFATASYTDTIYPGSNGDDATFGLAFGFNFGNGVTFSRRGYATLYPGD